MGYRKTSYAALVAGMKGQGKTALSDFLARDRARIVVFDVLGEYQGKGYVRAHSIGEVLKLIRKGWKRGYRIAYFPSREKMPFQLDELSGLLLRVQEPYFKTPDGKEPPIPKVLFIVEEMRWSYNHAAAAQYSNFATIMTLGRHYGLDVIGTTQRIAEVSPNFRGCCDVRFFFAQEEHTDITTITKMIGPKNRAALMGLQVHEYLRLYRNQLSKGRNVLN